jgi:transposase
VERIVAGKQTATLIYSDDTFSETTYLIAGGYETTRSQSYRSPSKAISWQERLLVIRSAGEVEKEMSQLLKRLEQASAALLALTPEAKQGRRQIRDENELRQKAAAILDRFSVCGLLSYTFAKEETTHTQYVGPGRGGSKRPKQTKTTARVVITKVQRNHDAIAQVKARQGWRLYATNQDTKSLPLEQALRLYRQAPRIERHFHLFKDAPIGLEPIYVRRDAQITGLCRLLSFCVRLLTLMEIAVRRNLKGRQEKLAGLYEGNSKQETDQPTAIRLLKAFRYVNRVHLVVEGQGVCYLTPLNPLQQQIIELLELDQTIYKVPFQNSE